MLAHHFSHFYSCRCRWMVFELANVINLSTRLGGTKNMSCKVLELYLMDACLSIFNMLNASEALSMNIMRIERLVTNE